MGPAPSITVIFKSLSTVISSSWKQCSQRLFISTVMRSFFRRPCTKGVAMASAAQAAKTFSPVLKVNL